MSPKKLLVLFLLIISYLMLNSQVFFNIRFDHLGVKDGLSQSTVNDIIQDYRGFLWFATLDGLNRFDGYNFKVYYNYGREGLSDNIITCLYETPDNHQLWIGTQTGGINFYNRVEDDFVYYNTSNSSLKSNYITAIAGDSHKLCVGTDKGIFFFYPERKKFVSPDTSAIFERFVYSLALSSDGVLWIGTDSGLVSLDTITGNYKIYTQNDGLNSEKITALILDSKNNLWIGTDKGLNYLDIQSGVIKNYNKTFKFDFFVKDLLSDYQSVLWIATEKNGLIRFNPFNLSFSLIKHNPVNAKSLSTDNLLSLYEDDAHIIWVGTSLGGINKWNRAAEELLLFRHNPYDESSLSSNQVRCFLEDSQGIVWVGTVTGGLNKWNKNLHKFEHYQAGCDECISGNHIRTLLEYKKGYLLIGTDKNGLDLFDIKSGKVIKKYNTKNSGLPSDRVWKIIRDTQPGRFWLALYGGGLCLFDMNNETFKSFRHSSDSSSLSSDYVTTVFSDSKNRLWIGTMDGLNLYNPDNQTFTVFKHSRNDKSLSDNRIYVIAEDKQGNIWIGTKGGLNKYNEDGTFQSWTAQNSDLPNNVILGILEDKNGNLWISTNRGISKIDFKRNVIKNYDINDGLQSNEFLLGSYYKTSDGMFLFGGINGFNAFYPEKIQINNHIPSLVITDFMVSNIHIPLDTIISEKKLIVLNHRQRDLTFRFVALDYILPEKNQYAYKLEGYDKDWIYCKNTREAKYTNLKPGRYVFRVKGSNNDGIWNEEGAKLIVIIKPAFWQTKAFKIGLVLFIIFSVWYGVRLRIRILKKRQELLEAEVERQTRQIRQQKEEIEKKNKVLEQQKEEILLQNEILQQQKEEIMAQRDEIEKQKEIAEKQRDEIAQHKKDIEDSIRYAKKIQTAILPTKDFLASLFKDYFIFYKPRDIVSGDFYWATEKDGKVIAVAADCTGHGVPGAFMSMLGVSFLTKIVNDKGITEADEILNRLRANVISALHQNSGTSETQDGMDLALVVIDYQQHYFEFAGANNPLYLIRNEQLIEYKPDKMPIGIFEILKPFGKQRIEFKEGDKIYMFSDGFADQFGGPKGKKFKYSRLKKLLLKVSGLPMQEQLEKIEKVYKDWISYPDPYSGAGSFQQIDDILIFGIEF